MDAARGPSFAADQDEGPQRGSGRPIPPLVSKIQVASTNAGARAQGGSTPDFLALSYRNGEKIASGFVESAINQVVSKRMVKKQQMGWSQRGAHLLLQIRTRVLDEEWENTFRRWYPDFRPQGQAKKAA